MAGHPQRALRSCFGAVAAAEIRPCVPRCAPRAGLKHSAVSYKSVQAILKNCLDRHKEGAQGMLDLPEHSNLRGAAHHQSSRPQ